MTTEPADCPMLAWHAPPPAEGAEWTACFACGTPQELPPPPMFWSDDVWRFLIERQPREIVLSSEPDEDGVVGEFVVPISGGLYVTLLVKLSDLLKQTRTTMISDWELNELKERAGVPAHWQPGRPL